MSSVGKVPWRVQELLSRDGLICCRVGGVMLDLVGLLWKSESAVYKGMIVCFDDPLSAVHVGLFHLVTCPE